MNPRLAALGTSVERLHRLVADLSDADLVAPAYPANWTIADVLSHIGSGAEIMQRRLDDSLVERPTPEDFTPGVWAAWNAKPPRAQAEEALVADRRLLERMESLSEDERSTLRFSMGPLELGFDGLVGMRLNEHALHTWDIEVVRNPSAVLPADATAQIVDNLELIARFTGKTTGAGRTIVVRTTGPERAFTITIGPDRVEFAPAAEAEVPDAEMPAEAFARLIYGRLDPEHSPPLTAAATVAVLRDVFPGP
jgi:uncharacterized protein (TIGR03083 family)